MRERYRMLWPMQYWLQEFNREILPVSRERFHQPPIRAGIVVQLFRGNIDVFAEPGGGAVIQRMRQWNFRLDPLKTEALQRQRFKKWRTCCKRMDCRTNVMQKAGQSEFGRTRAAADCRVCFVNNNRISRARQCDRGRETVRSGTNYDGVVFNRHLYKAFVILSEAKNGATGTSGMDCQAAQGSGELSREMNEFNRGSVSHETRKSQRCFASLNMTSGEILP